MECNTGRVSGPGNTAEHPNPAHPKPEYPYTLCTYSLKTQTLCTQTLWAAFFSRL